MGNSKGMGVENFGVSKGTVGGPIKIRKPSVVGYGYFLEFPSTAILIYMGMSPFAHIPAKPLNPPPTTTTQFGSARKIWPLLELRAKIR